MAKTLRRHRLLLPGACPLEVRRLLSGPTATWVGQDGHDYVGPYPAETPDGTQDIRIGLAGLPADRTIVSAALNGLGGGQWLYNGPYGPWKAALKRAPGASTADLFVEPDRAETGRAFNLVLNFDDGTTADLWFDGGKADPTLRMPSASVKVQWIGQDGQDFTGPSLNVGPDGIQDVHLAFTQLARATEVSKVLISGANGVGWQSGLNPQGEDNAEFVRDPSDPSKADLFLSPDRNLAGQTLTVHVVYATGRVDTTTVQAGATDPGLRRPPPPAAPSLRAGVSARWVGQDAPAPVGTGRVALEVSGIPEGRAVVGATLSDATHDSWTYRAPGQSAATLYSDPYAGTLSFQATGSGQAKLSFPPGRDESGTTLTLRLQFDDGSIAVATFDGGAADPGRLVPGPAASSITAKSGDDLNDLANRFGTVLLAPGTYTLDRPLILNQPVTIRAPQGGATLLFHQGGDQPAWTAAIKIHAGNTTLDGFSVRFDGPVRWRTDVDYGPAVIGTTDNLDTGHDTLKADISLTRLDLQSPPPTSPGEEAPRLIRVASAANGRIVGNTLRGGTTEFLHGPWTITGNTYLGTVAGTWAWDVFAGHFTNDLVLKDNTITPAADAGRTWRFLVLTGTGTGDLIEGNSIRGIGPRDGDTVSVNAAEVILTESYALHFEGKPDAISDNGRILQIPSPQGDPAGAGDVVAILDGPDAGRWYRIAQALSPTTYLMADPLPAGDYNISIGSGFVNQTYRNNTVDLRGSSTAAGMVLVGNHFGTEVVGNHILGGGEAIRVAAFPTERPEIWGWSHTPFLGGLIAGNTIEDASQGLTITVEHGPAIKSNRGRVYLSATVKDNRILWSDAFAAAHAGTTPPPGITIGEAGSIDPGELALALSGNLADVPEGTPAPLLRVNSGAINGEEQHDQSRPLTLLVPGLPSSVSLVNDTGTSASDQLTSDGRIRVGSSDRAVAFEYRVGTDGAYQAVSDPAGFLPAGLVEGANMVFVHAIDARGRRGPDRSLKFTLDTMAPATSPPALNPSSDTGRSDHDQVTRANALAFTVSDDPTDQIILLRDGQPVASGSSGTLADPGPLPDGLHRYALRRVDAAGNASESAAINVLVDTQAPGVVTALVVSADGRVAFDPTASEDEYLYRVGAGPLQSLGAGRNFLPAGLRPGPNAVEVFAVDPAGNIGPGATVAVNPAPANPAGVWLGQDGHDFVGPSPIAAPDGVQDMHIALAGLPTDQPIVFVDVQGLGGSRWQYGGPWGHWKAALVRQPGSASADLYLQPDRIETGRPYQILLRFRDGSTSEFWVVGGVADPSLRMPALDISQSASPPTGGGMTPAPLGPGRLYFAQLATRRRERLLQIQDARRERLATLHAQAMARVLSRRQFLAHR